MWYKLITILLVFTINYVPVFAASSKITIYELRQSLALGQVQIEATTSNRAAKEHFLLGAAFLHAFMYDLAIQQFQQAQKLDPGFAMSYWGEAMSYKHAIWNYENLTAAQDVLRRYENKKDQRHLSEKEKKYLHAVKILFSQETLINRDRAYLNAMAEFYKDFPHDPDIAAFYALSQLGFASDFPNEKSSPDDIKKGRELIRTLFQKFPNHPGTVHYYIHYHDTEDPTLPRQALSASKIALTLMRSSSHVTHMAAHIYRRLQLWDDYILANQISITAADQLCKKLSDKPLYACNAENKYHSLEWLHDGYLKKRQFDKANELVNQMATIVARDPDIIYKQWYYRMWARQVVLSKNWTLPSIKIQAISQPDDQLYWSAYSECGALLASSFLAIHHNQGAQSQLKRLDTVIQLTNHLSDPYIKQTCQIAKLQIQAETAKHQEEQIKASHYMKKALLLQKQQISTELTPSLNFLSANDYYRNYFLSSIKKG